MENHTLLAQISSLPLVSLTLLSSSLGSILSSPSVQFVYNTGGMFHISLYIINHVKLVIPSRGWQTTEASSRWLQVLESSALWGQAVILSSEPVQLRSFITTGRLDSVNRYWRAIAPSCSAQHLAAWKSLIRTNDKRHIQTYHMVRIQALYIQHLHLYCPRSRHTQFPSNHCCKFQVCHILREMNH